MRLSVAVIAVAAVVAAALVVLASGALLNPDRPLVSEAGFDAVVLSPNADGVADVVTFAFTLARTADVSLHLIDGEQSIYEFRTNVRTPPGQYAIQFSGVVDGFSLPDEAFEGTIDRRLVPDGDYLWEIIAVGVEQAEVGQLRGTLKIEGGDAELPLLNNFSVSPTTFTPNQDGVADRVAVSAYLTKPATVTAYLVDDAGERLYIAPRQTRTRLGEVGWQEFDYEGGVDIGAEPPPDGDYVIVLEAQDAVGQRVSQRGALTLQDGGKPRAGIVGQVTGADVAFSTLPYDEVYFSDSDGLGRLLDEPSDPTDVRLGTVIVPMGELLVFRLVVENYGASPIRTDGPPPGTVYQQDQVAAALNAIEQDGVWRVGVQCDTSEQSYPYRWAVGRFEDLRQATDPTNDNVYYYLAPGERSVVWGAVRLTDIVTTRNPQQCWAGLIHEGVAVANNRIGARDILIEAVSPEAGD
ncbi:MAG: hypothetical protein MUC99_03110 [Anaerolineae bacterium]|nr:hypothetical protein [Anaerolineae bacterium]